MRLPGTILFGAVVCVTTLAATHYVPGGGEASVRQVVVTATPTADASPTPTSTPTVTVTELATTTATVTATPCVPTFGDRLRARRDNTPVTCSTGPEATS